MMPVGTGMSTGLSVPVIPKSLYLCWTLLVAVLLQFITLCNVNNYILFVCTIQWCHSLKIHSPKIILFWIFRIVFDHNLGSSILIFLSVNYVDRTYLTKKKNTEPKMNLLELFLITDWKLSEPSNLCTFLINIDLFFITTHYYMLRLKFCDWWCFLIS